LTAAAPDARDAVAPSDRKRGRRADVGRDARQSRRCTQQRFATASSNGDSFAPHRALPDTRR
jgi:hypothetical protein